MYIVEITNGSMTTPIHDLKTKLHSGKITKGINAIDSFTFSILPDNDGFSLINEFTTLVTVYNTNKARYDFIGRVLYAETTMDENGLITKSVTCESIFGYLCDSQQTYVDTQNWTVTGLLQHLIDCHNSQVEEYKRFKIGTVTATDSNDNLYQGIQRENTWNAIKSKLIDKIGGELQFRIEDDGIYIDYLEQIGEEKTTPIALSVNMKSITREQDPTAFVTRLIPLGCKLKDDEGNETEHRLDITSVNNGISYIDDEQAIAVYGIHVGVVEWDDVTDPSNLMNKGESWIKDNNKVQVKYTVTSLDLSLLGLVLDDFDVGNTHPLLNDLIGVNDKARIIKKTIDVCNEVESSIEIGDSFKTLSDIQRDISEQLKAAEENVKNLQGDSKDVKNQLDSINKVLAESKAFIGVVSTKAYYYLSTSNTALTGGEWSETPPEWVSGCYYWQKIVTTYTDESTTESEPVCISGEKGENGLPGTPGESGSDGVGVSGISTLFYLSTSKETPTGGEWSETQPAWSRGYYLWIRSVITYTDGAVAYTEPYCDTAWEAIIAVEETFTSKIEQLEKSITLEVSGSLGSNASIILSAGDNKYTGELELSQVREAFANDPTAISISAGTVTFNAGTLIINSSYFQLDSTGKITATSGKIGKWSINENKIYAGDGVELLTAVMAAPRSDNTYVFAAGGKSHNDYADCPFRVNKLGKLYATDAVITGNVTATSGTIGGCSIVDGVLQVPVANITGTITANSLIVKNASGTVLLSAGDNAVTIGGWTVATNGLFKSASDGQIRLIPAGDLSTSYTVNGYSSKTWVILCGPNNGTTAKFGVTKAGALYCTDAVISGEILTIDGNFKTELDNGSLKLYYSDTLCGTINTKYWSSASTPGLSLRVEEGGEYIMFSHYDPDVGSGFSVDYVLNYGWSSYDEAHLFYTSARFMDKVTMTNLHTIGMYLRTGYFIKAVDSDGNVGEELLGFSASSGTVVGSNYATTLLRGSTVYLKTTSTTVTSDRNAKNSIEALPDEYEAFFDNIEPVRFKYNDGTSGRYHVGYIAQNVEAALTTAGLTSMDFAGYVDINFTGELGLSYDEFIALLHKKIKRLEQRIAVLEAH